MYGVVRRCGEEDGKVSISILCFLFWVSLPPLSRTGQDIPCRATVTLQTPLAGLQVRRHFPCYTSPTTNICHPSSQPMIPPGHPRMIAAPPAEFLEWMVSYYLMARDTPRGKMLLKDDVRAIIDGTLFYRVAKEIESGK